MSINTLRNVFRNGPVEVNLVELTDPSNGDRDERYEYSCATCPSERFYGHVSADDEEGVVRDAEIHFELFHTHGVKVLREETFLTYYADVVRDWPTSDRQSADTLTLRWLDRGDGVAFYRNEDLGHPGLGHVQIVSFGGSLAQLVVDAAKQLGAPGDGVPPTKLPDIGGEINWRYQLAAYYRRSA